MSTVEIERQLNDIIRLLGLIYQESKTSNEMAAEMMRMMNGLGK